MIVKNKCAFCSIKIRPKHYNTKYCPRCSIELRKKPIGSLTENQIKRLHKLKGNYSRKEIAIKLNCSISNLQRFCRDSKISLATKDGSCKYRVNPSLIDNVIKYYEEHGLSATQEKFPKIKIRSIVERYSHAKRCTKWKDEQIIELVKMAGLISKQAQADYFKRPRANQGSIQSVWAKKLYGDPRYIHGLPNNIAKHLVIDRKKFIKLKYKKLFLWSDLINNLRPDIPTHLIKAIEAMAIFQKWLFNNKNPREQILLILKKRSGKNER
jgi:hypothetical protein